MTTDALKGLDIPGVSAEWAPKRIYPIGIAASTVTGFVNVDQAGTEGMEKAFQDDLRGAPGWSTYFRDGAGNLHPGQEKPAEPGNDLVLTIDSYLQQVAYQKLAEGVTRLNAVNGWVLVIDVRTGDILAMANAPGYDPTFFERSDSELYRNHIISDMIEPGSTIKAITASAALEEGTRRPDTPVDCGGGRWNYLGRTISDHEGMGTVPFIDTFVHSSNVGMAKTGVALGSERMHHWLKQFGFGVKTGIPLEGGEGQRRAARALVEADGGVGGVRHSAGHRAADGHGLRGAGQRRRADEARLVREVRAPGGRVLSPPTAGGAARGQPARPARARFHAPLVERGTGRRTGASWAARPARPRSRIRSRTSTATSTTPRSSGSRRWMPRASSATWS
jgi:cell division protein FtsI (penicillin-binding protein 3)